MQIICQHCDTLNDVKKIKLKCGKCQNELSNTSYLPKKIRKKAIATIGVLSAGTIVGYGIANEQSRLPIEIEYELVEACISESQKPMKSTYLYKKKDVCLCLLANQLEKGGADEYFTSPTQFLGNLENNLDNCLESK